MATLTFRTFRNSDPPILAELWRSRDGEPGLARHVTTELLDQLVLAKLYFDREGLILAFDGDRAVGYGHAGFGPNADQSWVSTENGVISLLMVRPDCPDAAAVAGGLLERCESYLLARGAKSLFGGAMLPWSPFYLGLYGGSESPGVLESDGLAQQTYLSHGYEAAERAILVQRDLSGFVSLIDRQQMQLRRQMIVEVTNDAPTRTWWEASSLGQFDLTRFDLIPRTGGTKVATAIFRSMEPSVTNAMSRSTGLIHFDVIEAYRRRGVANFLLSEAFRQFIRQGIVSVEAQIPEDDEPALAATKKLGFRVVNTGTVFKKK